MQWSRLMRFRTFGALLGCVFVLPVLSGAQQPGSRASLIARAQVWAPTDIPTMNLRVGPGGADAFAPNAAVRCDYVEKDFEGGSLKFGCRIGGNDVVKVKFGGSNGEVYGEVAATRLLWALGFGADRMYPVRVICRGCPDDIGSPGPDGTRFVEPAAIERKIEGSDPPGQEHDGWSWNEVDLIDETRGGATRAQRDALKLLAAFMQHTDTKPEQQRMVCRDPGCERPFLMLNDVGLTFGRANLFNSNAVAGVNLDEWIASPVWKGDNGCVANLTRSFSGTLKDPVISEEGRQFLARLLAQLSPRQRRDLFEAARVERRVTDGGEAGAATVDDWVLAFNKKEAEIEQRRCADPWSAAMPIAFQVEPVLWVQSWASPSMTRVMNGISLLGYTPAYIAVAVLLAFGVRLRAGAGLLLLLALTGALTDAAKVIVSLPRPDAVDSRVRAMGLFPQAINEDSGPEAAIDDGAAYGFPSGHLAMSTAFFLGLARLFGWRWAWVAMLGWLPLMALSRMYLGRHFVADVLGGVAVGVVCAAIAVLWWRLPRIENPTRGWRVARRAVYTGLGLVLLALVAGMPPEYEAARLLGFALGALLVSRMPEAQQAATPGVAARRIAVASLIYLCVWYAADWSGGGPLLTGTIPAALLLPAPLYVERKMKR